MRASESRRIGAKQILLLGAQNIQFADLAPEKLGGLVNFSRSVIQNFLDKALLNNFGDFWASGERIGLVKGIVHRQLVKRLVALSLARDRSARYSIGAKCSIRFICEVNRSAVIPSTCPSTHS